MSLLMESSLAKIGCGDPGDPIDFSGLFNGGSLSRVLAVGDRKTCSMHGWVKIVTIDGTRRAIIAANQGSTTRGGILYDGNIEFHDNGSTHRSTTGTYKDAAGWFSLLLRKKSDLAVEAGRVEFWIGGKLVSTSTGSALPENALSQFGTASEMRIGDSSQDSAFLAYMAELVFLDGIYADPTDFGRFNAYGDWVNKRYAGPYGANGFHLDFADPVDLGKDISGNGNDFVVSGSLAQSTDTPSSAFAVIDPNSCSSTITLSNGNLTFDRVSNSGYPAGIAAIPFSSGIFKAEATKSLGGNTGVFGVARVNGLCAVGSEFSSCDHLVYMDQAGDVRNNGGVVSDGPYWDGTVGFEVNADTSEVYVTRSTGERVGPFTLSGTGSIVFFTAAHDLSSAIDVNFGQVAFVWSYSDEVKPLSLANLTCPAVTNPDDYVTVRVCLAGGGVDDLLWDTETQKTLVLSRRFDVSSDWRINDNIRGSNLPIACNIGGAEITTEVDGLTSFVASGYTIGDAAPYQGSRVDMVWRASPEAGFDIITIDHTQGAASTVAHDVGGAIHYGWICQLDGGDVFVFHHLMPAGAYTKLNSQSAYGTLANWLSSTANTVTLGADMPSGRYILYIWRTVYGLSAFPLRKGNASAHGSHLPLELSPRVWIPRAYTVSEDTPLYCLDREPENPKTFPLHLNNSVSGASTSTRAADFNSLSVKARVGNNAINGNLLYADAVWGGVPSKFATVL